jgi:hypothetical protein
MPADIHDHNQLPAILTTQVTPTNYQTAGAVTTVTSVIISTPVAASQITTQQNEGPGLVAPYPTMTSAVAPQSALVNPSGGVIGSGSLAIVAAPLTSYSPINTPSPGLTAVPAQISSQTNPNSLFAGISQAVGDGLNTVTSNEQNTAVIGPVYYSPGGVLNKVGPSNSNLTTGGGP